jgi:hypothetical protein
MFVTVRPAEAQVVPGDSTINVLESYPPRTTFIWSTPVPFATALQLENIGAERSQFRLRFNGEIYYDVKEIVEAIHALPNEFQGESFPRKAWRFIIDRKYDFVPLTHNSWFRTPVPLINSAGYGYCRDFAFVFKYIMRAAGLDSRVWGFPSHSVPEVLWEGKWQMLDPTYQAYYFDSVGTVTGVDDIKTNSRLVSEPVVKSTAALPPAYMGALAQEYASGEVIDEIPPADSDSVEILLPPGARLVFPGTFDRMIRGTFDTWYVPSHANLKVTVPVGGTGDVDMPLIIQSITGRGQVIYDGARYDVGSEGLREALERRDSFVHRVTVTSARTEVSIMYLINPRVLHLGMVNTVEICGEQAGVLRASSLLLEEHQRVPSGRVAVTVPSATSGVVEWSLDRVDWHRSNDTVTVAAGRDLNEWGLDPIGLSRVISFRNLGDGPVPVEGLIVVPIGGTASIASGPMARRFGFLSVSFDSALCPNPGPTWVGPDGADHAPGKHVIVPTGEYSIQFKGDSTWHLPATRVVIVPRESKTGLSATLVLNRPPAVSFVADTIAEEDREFQLAIFPQDPDSFDSLTLTLVSFPSWLTPDSTNRLLRGTPGLLTPRDTVVTVQVRDLPGARVLASIPIHVHHINHLPGFASDPDTVAHEDSAYAWRVRIVDPDTLIGDRVTTRVLSKPHWLAFDTLSREFSGTPSAHDVGDASVRIILIDEYGGTNQKIFTLKVHHTNHTPTIFPSDSAHIFAVEDSTLSFTMEALDSDVSLFGDSLRFVGVDLPRWVSLDYGYGTVHGTPREGDIDTLVRICVSDGHLSDTVAVPINVRHVNDSPVLSKLPSIVVSEGVSRRIDLKQYCTDPDNDPTEIRWTVDLGTLPNPPGAFSRHLNGKAGAVHLSAAQWSGSTWTAKGLNRGAKPSVISPMFGASLQRLTIVFSRGLQATDSLTVDVDDESHSLQVSASPDFWGYDIPVLVTAFDPEGLSASDTVLISVLPVNDPPSLAPIPPFVCDGFDSTFVAFKSLYPYLHDPDNVSSLHRWSIDGSSNVRTWADAAGIRLIPLNEWYGTDTLRVIARDPGGLADTSVVILNVRAVSHCPRITTLPDSVVYAEIPYSWKLDVTDRNPADTTFTFSLRGPGWMSVDSTGVLAGRPLMPGVSTVEVVVTDKSGNSDTVSFRITVKSNDETHDLAGAIPASFVLKQNYPNPFNPRTTIRFGVPERARVHLAVYNILGQRVETLLEEERDAGYFEVVWNPTRAASGSYFILMDAQSATGPSHSYRATQRMILLK